MLRCSGQSRGCYGAPERVAGVPLRTPAETLKEWVWLDPDRRKPMRNQWALVEDTRSLYISIRMAVSRL